MDHLHALFEAPTDPSTLRVIPLGGIGEFGMNLTAYLYGERLYVVDCGVRFPEPHKLGIDAIIPEVDPFFEQTGGVFAYIMTHGHEDHIGALPHLLRRWPAPVYGTAWTLELIRARLRRLGMDPGAYSLVKVEPGDVIIQGDFSAEFVHVNHSLPMTCALFIKTPAAHVFHTGDFKFDAAPVIEPPTDFGRLAQIAAEGVDFLIADSTNADKAGNCPAEGTVLEPLIGVFRGCQGAIFCTTFASNLWRLKVIADACLAVDRRLYIAGAGLEQTLFIAKTLGLYELPPGLRATDEDLPFLSRERLVVLATGCQGEWRSAMARIAARESKTFKVEPGDTVVLSARIIPGNERAILAMINEFIRQGAHIVTPREAPGIHVSGHAYRGDLERLCQTLRPRHFAPMHGAFGQLDANHRMATVQLSQASASHLIQTGDVLDLRKDGVRSVGKVEVPLAYVDSESAVVISADLLRERLKIGELGLATLEGVYAAKERRWLAPPRIELVGLRLPDALDAEAWLERTATTAGEELVRLLHGKRLPAAEMVESLRISLRRQLSQVLRKKPVVSVKVHLI